MKKQTIIITVIIIVALAGFIAWAANASKPNPNDPKTLLAKYIAQSGAIFYGAFWCPHCQAQKAEFGGSAEYLPYHECSTPDGKSQLQSCDDVNVESYPTWVYPKPITETSTTPPIVCPIQPGPANQPSQCSQPGFGSSYYETWTFPTVKILSSGQPTQSGDSWTFPANSRTEGAVSLQDLANFTGYTGPVPAQ